jgi:hypothetical protein
MRQVFTFQPAGRYWLFRGIEAALYLTLTAVLITRASSRWRRIGGRAAT